MRIIDVFCKVRKLKLGGRREVVATISRTTSTQTQMKSQFEKPHSTTRQTEGHNTSHKYAPSYENQLSLSQ